MAATIRELLETVEWRLGETVEAFTLMRTINERCNTEVNSTLHALINARGGFWKPVTVGLQTTVITGINALLDKGSNDSATLYLVLKKLSAQPQSPLPAGIENTLDTIRDRYKKFRHKLFGHNDINREAVANEFDQAGFTWVSLGADLEELEYVFKLLWHVMGGQPIPDRSMAKAMIYPYAMSVARTQKDTSEFLADVEAYACIPKA